MVNDQDPAPLRYQLLAEYSYMFNWEPEKQGLDEWNIRIQRIETGSPKAFPSFEE